MKTIYTIGAFGEPYRIELSDKIIKETRFAQRVLRRLPWDGELFIPIDSVLLDNSLIDRGSVEIIVGKNIVSICTEGPEGRETLLDSDDLLTIPDIYVSKYFEFKLKEFMLSLSLHDIDLITIWEQKKQSNLVNF